MVTGIEGVMAKMSPLGRNFTLGLQHYSRGVTFCFVAQHARSPFIISYQKSFMDSCITFSKSVESLFSLKKHRRVLIAVLIVFSILLLFLPFNKSWISSSEIYWKREFEAIIYFFVNVYIHIDKSKPKVPEIEPGTHTVFIFTSPVDFFWSLKW